MKSQRKVRIETIDDYLATIGEEKRAPLQKLRRTIRAAAPAARECISYGVPGFRLDGRLLVSFGAGAHHCAFYPGAIVQEFEKELAGYDTSKGTIRFAADEPLPASLVRRIVKARIASRRRGSARHRRKEVS